MLRIYHHLNNWFSSFMSSHEKDIYTTGARMLAVACVVIAIIIAYRCTSQFF